MPRKSLDAFGTTRRFVVVVRVLFPDRLPRGERTKPLGGLRQWGMQRPKGGAGRSPKWGFRGQYAPHDKAPCAKRSVATWGSLV